MIRIRRHSDEDNFQLCLFVCYATLLSRRNYARQAAPMETGGTYGYRRHLRGGTSTPREVYAGNRGTAETRTEAPTTLNFGQ